MDIKDQRNRFLAFSFASADLLLELDESGAIAFAMGASKRFAGRAAEALSGLPIKDLFVERDRPLLRALMDNLSPGERMGPILLTVAGPAGEAQVTVSGCRMPHETNRVYLSLSVATPTSYSEALSARRDAETGLLQEDAFREAAQHTLEAANALGQDLKLTLLNLSGQALLLDRLGPEKAQLFLSHIGALMRAQGVNDVTGRVGEDSFGLIQDQDTDAETLPAQLTALATKVDPSGEGLSVTRREVALSGNLSEAETAKALSYAVRKFAEAPDDFHMSSLQEAVTTLLDETVQRMAEIRTALNSGTIAFAAQPIVDLNANTTHHFEMLVRFADGQSPQDMVVFAEEVGLIHELDLMVAQKALDALQRTGRFSPVKLAVNVSGRSIMSPRFVSALLRLLMKNPGFGERMIFEVTETSQIDDLVKANHILQSIRRLGHKVCLDDFGAGAASFQYLQALEIDYVKIDGAYVRDGAQPREQAMLKAMISMCDELQIATVAEMIETAVQRDLLSGLGAKYGQGYLFGRPEPLGSLLGQTAPAQSA